MPLPDPALGNTGILAVSANLLWPCFRWLPAVPGARALRDAWTTLSPVNRRRFLAMSVSLVAVFCTAVLAAPLLFLKILRSLAKVERLAGAIADGKFERIEEPHSHDELDSVIRAVNSMSARLSSREAEILQSKKLASLGTLTAGVAHEITNPVNNISMLAETYETMADDLSQAERQDMMRQIQKECGRIHGIVTNLLDFSKPKAATTKPVAINELVNNTLPLVRNMLHVSNIDLRLDLVDNAPWALVDTAQMHQVLVNCITNAIQSMKWRWRAKRQAAGKPADKPNLVCGPVQVCWHKFARYFDVELREIPMAITSITATIDLFNLPIFLFITPMPKVSPIVAAAAMTGPGGESRRDVDPVRYSYSPLEVPTIGSGQRGVKRSAHPPRRRAVAPSFPKKETGRR